jgi:hypothetical protein
MRVLRNFSFHHRLSINISEQIINRAKIFSGIGSMAFNILASRNTSIMAIERIGWHFVALCLVAGQYKYSN